MFMYRQQLLSTLALGHLPPRAHRHTVLDRLASVASGPTGWEGRATSTYVDWDEDHDVMT